MPGPHTRLIARKLDLPPARYDVSVTKDLRVAMDDGITLRTDHFFPRAKGSFPTILVRTPYYGGRWLRTDLPGLLDPFFARRFAERGYNVVVQTTRGRFESDGDFRPFVQEASDGRATLEWIAAQSWFDGSLGTWGPSYLGYTQFALAPGAPSFLKAMVPTFASATVSPIMVPDGAVGETPLQWAYLVELANQGRWTVLESLRRANPRTLKKAITPALSHLPLIEADTLAIGREVPYYREWLRHARLDDDWWESHDHRNRLPEVSAPVHLVTGWHDFFLRELLADYAVLEAAGTRPYLTVGPQGHGVGGAFASLEPGLTWFDAHLKGDGSRLRELPVRVWVRDAGEWRDMQRWPPPADETRFFLRAEGRLSSEGPDDSSPFDRYRYDPADPTPSLGGPELVAKGGPVDNRPLEARDDVLVYTSEPLTNDLEVIGPVRLELFVRSDQEHTDFFGRLCEVHPDGRSLDVCDGLARVEPGIGEPQPDGTRRVEVDLWATAKRFRRGNRIRVLVASGAHPRWVRNLGTGEPIATATRMVPADQEIHHDAAHPSALVVPVVG